MHLTGKWESFLAVSAKICFLATTRSIVILQKQNRSFEYTVCKLKYLTYFLLHRYKDPYICACSLFYYSNYLSNCSHLCTTFREMCPCFGMLASTLVWNSYMEKLQRLNHIIIVLLPWLQASFKLRHRGSDGKITLFSPKDYLPCQTGGDNQWILSSLKATFWIYELSQRTTPFM